MKKILIIHTGGTIAMKEEKSGAVKPQENNPLHETLPSLTSLANIEMVEMYKLPSPHIVPEKMLTLAKTIIDKITKQKYDGVVVTHGTDTLEETAYFLDLYSHSEVPIVFTGAMRSSNEIGSDGPYNLIAAVRVACSDTAKGKGVLVVLNDEIHTAKNVTKTHTSSVATFQSPQYGPIGNVTKRGVNFHHTILGRDLFQVNRLTKKVELLKAYAGMDDSLFIALNNMKIDGLVIEALGQGNLPPATVNGLKTLIQNKIPIVLVSRCFNGIVQDTYGYEGGGKHLKDLGVIFSNGLNGQKARIKLMMILEITSDFTKIQQAFL